MPARSAGLLLYRIGDAGVVEVLVAHPGGPFWARKDDGAWSVPKGEPEPGEDELHAAQREFEEETGCRAPDGERLALGDVVQPSRKRVSIWAVEGDLDISTSSSNRVSLEWPRGSGRVVEFPEVDRVEWMTIATARVKLLKGQAPFLDRLMEALTSRTGRPTLLESPPGA